MTTGYRLLTIRIKPQMYQHRLFLNDVEFDINDLPVREAEIVIKTMGNNSRALEYMKSKGINRDVDIAAVNLERVVLK